jgi:hypothetical protein
MSAEYSTRPRAEVRRRDRAVGDPEWIRGLLRRAPLGTLATARDGQPFINIEKESNRGTADVRCSRLHRPPIRR